MATRAEQILARKDQILSQKAQEEEVRRLDTERLRLENEEREKKQREEYERIEQGRICEIRLVFEKLGVMQIFDELACGIPDSSIAYETKIIKWSNFPYPFTCVEYLLKLYFDENRRRGIRVTYSPSHDVTCEVVIKDLFGSRKVKKTNKIDPKLEVNSLVVSKDKSLDELIAEALACPEFIVDSDGDNSVADQTGGRGVPIGY